jgi:glycosyltransferase involved in cell wall biosynthesis
MQFIKYFSKKKHKAKRSVVFYRHSYYHFYYLAKALRTRGWDAIVVNLEPPNGSNEDFYHGEDINLFNSNPIKFNLNIKKFYKTAKSRFALMHFAGDGYLSFFPNATEDEYPKDILQWLKLNNKIAYTVSGCNSGRAQSSIHTWSSANNNMSVCERCIWQENEQVCNDTKNLDWGKKVHQYCDLIFTEAGPSLDYMKSGNKVIREPTTMCVDKDFWQPNLAIPDEHKLNREQDETFIYHAVGNYNTRNSTSKNIKGTPFIFDAIERLKQEGYKVRLVFLTDKPNKVVRYYQVQADIIVDQLNYGRYGATAREGMMLGKPVISYLNKSELDDNDSLDCLDECPLVSATEQSIYDVLKSLVINADLRKEIGLKSRDYALKWHSAEACAERYEKAYDQLFDLTD